MEKPDLSAADERAAGSGQQYDPNPEARSTHARTASPEENRRKAEQAEKAQQEQRKDQQPAQEESEGVRQRIFVDKATINTYDRPMLIFPEQMHNHHAKNPDIEEENARREGELRGMRSSAEEKVFIRDQSRPDAVKTKEEYLKMQAAWNAQKAIETDRILSEHKLSNLEHDKRHASHDVQLALHKRQALRDAVPVAKQIEEGKEDADVKIAVQEHIQSRQAENKLNGANIDRERRLAVQDGITNAISSLAAKEYLRNNDYDQTLRGKFILLAKEVAIRLAIEALVDVAKQGGSYCKSKLYQTYLNLPLQHCKDLKEQEEMIAQFNAMQARQQMLRSEKKDIQQTLVCDAQLLKKEEDNIRYFEKILKSTQDEKEKEHMQNVVDVLKQQHQENRIKYAMLLKLNADQQPHFQRLMAENQRKMRQQKEREAQRASAQAAGA